MRLAPATATLSLLGLLATACPSAFEPSVTQTDVDIATADPAGCEGVPKIFERSPDAGVRDAKRATGRLAPETIQCVVRRNFGDFRICYERGLARDPKLSGRINARFVIERDGTVSHTTDGSNSPFPDADVVGCVLTAFGRMTFPAPDGGIVTVVYPIMLAPD